MMMMVVGRVLYVGGAWSLGRKVDKCLLSEGERRGTAVGTSEVAARRVASYRLAGAARCTLYAAPAGPYCLHA